MEMTVQLERYGASLVFANVLAQQLGLPIPVEPTLVVAGILAARGAVSPVRVVIAAISATIVADAIWFVMGRRYEQKLERLLTSGKEAKAKPRGGAFLRWGLPALLLARFIPGAVQMIVPLAGARHAHLSSFIFYDLTGIVLWASIPVTGGMLFHDQAESVLHAMSGNTIWFGVAAFVAAAAVLLRRRFVKGRA